jgi:predicted NBD/HSP70 family sugar kinase
MTSASRNGSQTTRSFATGTPRLLRAINERTILELIRDAGTLSRSQMASRSGLSKPTVSQALVGLSDAGLVLEQGRSSGRKGPGATLYVLNARVGFVVGIDVGRHWVRAALADITGAVVARRQERAASSRRIAAQIGGLAAGLAADAGAGRDQLVHATVGISGVLDPARGALELAPNLPGSRREGFADEIRDRLDIETSFENDVNLAALGESWRGAGQGVANFVFLWVGTGVGLGIVIDGGLYRGAYGAAGEIAYIPVGGDDPFDPHNRRRGALEEAAGASAVVKLARDLGMTPPLSVKSIFAAARRGDETANRVVDLEARRIALAIAAVAPILDPELVILGGGIAAGGADLLADAAARELGRLSPFRPRLVGSNLGDDAVVYGALATALAAAQEQVFNRSPHRDGREIVV